MWMPVKLNSGASYPYGFGWAMDGTGEHPIITHDGITGTEYSRFPNDNLTVIVLTNLGRRRRDDSEVNSWGLTKEIAARLIPNIPKTRIK
jgi:CubicO group peptidase (beta-lactamase class C family)